jgi:hypothetical protein
LACPLLFGERNSKEWRARSRAGIVSRTDSEELSGCLSQDSGKALLIVALRKDANFSIPGIGEIRKVSAVHNTLRSHLDGPMGLVDGEVLGDRHGRVQPQIVVFLDEFGVGDNLIDTQVGYAQSQSGKAAQYFLNAIGSAEFVWMLRVLRARWLASCVHYER